MQNVGFKVNQSQSFTSGINEMVTAALRDAKPVFLKNCITKVDGKSVGFTVHVVVQGQQMPTVDKETFKALLDLLMCSDPYPCDGEYALKAYADATAIQLGFDGWIDAYHRLEQSHD